MTGRWFVETRGYHNGTWSAWEGSCEVPTGDDALATCRRLARHGADARCAPMAGGDVVLEVEYRHPETGAWTHGWQTFYQDVVIDHAPRQLSPRQSRLARAKVGP